MERKWTLDRIEFDNETYEVTRPEVPPAGEQQRQQLALALQLIPADTGNHRSPRRPLVPPGLATAKAGIDDGVLCDRRDPIPVRRLH